MVGRNRDRLVELVRLWHPVVVHAVPAGATGIAVVTGMTAMV
jgi:hypothetical protein